MDKPVAVIGGGGRVGRLVVAGLLAEGERVRVLGRSARDATAERPTDCAFFQADVRTPATLAEPLRGCSAIVYTVEPGTADSGPDRPETTMYRGVLNAIAAATADGDTPHLVLVSQIYVTRKNHPINSYGGMLDWRAAGEDAVRGSGLPYTVVRPSWLTNRREAGTGIRLEQGDRGDGQVSRQDVADAVLHSLADPRSRGLTFEVYNEPGAPRPWSELIAGLVPDPAHARLER